MAQNMKNKKKQHFRGKYRTFCFLWVKTKKKKLKKKKANEIIQKKYKKKCIFLLKSDESFIFF